MNVPDNESCELLPTGTKPCPADIELLLDVQVGQVVDPMEQRIADLAGKVVFGALLAWVSLTQIIDEFAQYRRNRRQRR